MAYSENEKVKQAREQLTKQEEARPAGYESTWTDRVKQTIDSILNGKDFSYEANQDPLYRQSVQEHLRAGQAAMGAAMGQTAAQAGGYGTSYAQNVGQQVYQGHVQKANDMIPALYQLALSKYGLDSDNLYRKAALIGDQEARDYSRHMDAVDQWRRERDWQFDQYNNERAFDYGAHRDAVSDEQWNAEFDEALRRWQLQWDAAHQPAVSGGGGSGGSGGSGGGLTLNRALGAYYGTPTTTGNDRKMTAEEVEALYERLDNAAAIDAARKENDAYNAAIVAGNKAAAIARKKQK